MDEHMKKRPRLSSAAYGSIATRTANDETSLEVDHLTLDYLAWKAAEASFEDPQDADAIETHQKISAVEDFLLLFHQRHPGFKFDMEMRLRISVLKLVVLLTHRFRRGSYTADPSSIRAMREKNRERTSRWKSLAKHGLMSNHNVAPFDQYLPLPSEQLERNRARLLAASGVPGGCEAEDDRILGPNDCVSLLDVLPLFLRVCAASRALHGCNMSDQLINLALEMMMKACLEQYLILGACGTDVVVEAFGWGFEPDQHQENEVNHLDGPDLELNALFENDETGLEVPGWADSRDSKVALFFHYEAHMDKSGDSHHAFHQHLQSLDNRLPSREWNQRLRDFLRLLSCSIDEPVLAQLEKGQLKGMSVAETHQFLQSCGRDVARTFEQNPIDESGTGE